MGANTTVYKAVRNIRAKKYTFLLFFLSIVQFVSSQINNPDFRAEVNSNDLGPCGGGGDAFTFINVLSKNNNSNSFRISFALPNGVTYMPGTAEIRTQDGSSDFVLTIDDTDSNAPIFTLERPGNLNWQTSDRVRFRFRKTADCDAVQFSYNGGLFKDAHAISYENGSGTQTATNNDPTINSYNFLSPLLSTLNYSNVTVNNGEAVSRTIEVTNSGNGNTQLFYHTVTVDTDLDDVYELRYNGTVLLPTSVAGNTFNYTIDIGAAPFIGNVGNGDANFEETEVVLLEERFVVEDCGSHSITHQSEWGCSVSEICQITSPVSASVDVSAENPILNIRELSSFGRVDLVNGATYEAQMVNEGSIPAYNVILNTGFGTHTTIPLSSSENGLWGNDGPEPYKQISNFRFTDTGDPMPMVRLPHTQFSGRGLGSYALLNDSDYGMPGVDPDGPGGLEDLDGDGFFDDLAPGATINYSFDFDFAPNIPICNTGSANVIRDWSVRSQGISQNQCGTEVTANRAYFNDGRFRISGLTVSNPSDIFDGQAFTVDMRTDVVVSGRDAPNCNGNSFFNPNPNTTMEVIFTVPDGVSLDSGAGPEFSTTGPNTIRYLTSNLPQSELLREDISFPFQFSCGATATGPIDLDYTISYFGPCIDMNLYCGTITTTAICPANCDGPSINSFDANRITAGWTDESMATKVTLDPSIHATNFYAARDEMLISAIGQVNAITVDNLHFDLTYRTPSGAAGGADLIEFLPTTNPLAANKSELLINGVPFDITLPPNVTDEGSQNYRIRFDLSSFAPNFNPGDQLDLRLKFRWNDNFNNRNVYDLENFRGEYFYFDGGGAKVSCISLGDEAKYLKPAVFVQSGTSNGTGCTPFNDSSRLFAQTNSAADHFPDEFRPPVLFTSATNTLPPNMELANNNIIFSGFPGSPSVSNGRLSFTQSGNQITVTPTTTFLHRDMVGNAQHYLRIPVIGSIDTPDSGTNSYDMSYVEYAYSDYPEPRLRTQNKTFNHNKPNFAVTSPNSVTSGNQPEVTYELEVCGTSDATIPFNWLQLGTTSNFTVTEVVLVSGASTTSIPFVQNTSNTWIEMGSYPNGSTTCKIVRFTGTYTECNNFDIPVSSSWACGGYPVSPSEYGYATYTDQLTLRLEPQTATLQLLITEEPTTSVDVCTDFNIGLEMRNADAGDLIDPYITFDIPGDVSGVLINDIQVEYPRGSGDIQNVSSNLVGNQVNVNIIDHTAIAAEQGIKGASNAVNLNEQIAIINLNLNLRCDFTSNTAITYAAYGNNTCGIPAEGDGVRLSTDPLVLNGAESTYSTTTTITTANGGLFQGCDTQTISVQTVIVDDGPTSNDDTAQIILPDGLSFVSGSLNSGTFVPLTNPVITVVDNHEEMTVNMPVGASNGDFVLYSFDMVLKNGPIACAPAAPITINNFEISSALSCGGVSCSDSATLVGSSSTNVTLEKAEISASGTAQAIYAQLDSGDTEYEISFEIRNNTAIEMPTGALYDVFCTDAGGAITGTSLYTGTLGQALAPNGTFAEDTIFVADTFCGPSSNLLILFDPSNTNCHCDPLEIRIASMERTSDLELTMTADNTTVPFGQTVTFTMDLVNNGPFDGQNIITTSIIPSGFTVTSLANGAVQSGNTITWTQAELANGTNTTYGFTANARLPTQMAGEFEVVSEVLSFDGVDPDSTPGNHTYTRPLEDDEAVLDITVLDEVDLELEMTVDKTSVFSSETVTFTLDISNNGPIDTESVLTTLVVPDGFTVTLITNGGTQSGNIISWTEASLPNGNRSTYGFTAAPNRIGGTSADYTFISEVNAFEGTDQDSNPNNYSASRPLEDDESVMEIDVIAVADIAITKTADVSESFIEGIVIFTVTAANQGIDAASDIGIEDVLPNGFQLVSATTTLGNYNEQNGLWIIDSLDAGEFATLEVEVRVREDSDYTNVASLEFVTPVDNNAYNDWDEVTISVTRSECLTVYNEFSPNGDGLNDVFFIECIEEYPDNFLQVFNRWGNMVFEAKNYDNRWSGISEGRATINAPEKLPVGTYYYVLNLGNESPVKTGWIYISR